MSCGPVMDSETILPDFPSVDDHSSQNYNSYSEMRLPGPSTTENMDDSLLDVEIKGEVKVELGELFMERSIDEENDETGFPAGLILFPHEPTVTASHSLTETETHLLPYTPVYSDEKGSQSSLQLSAPNSSFTWTGNLEMQFPQLPIQPKRSGGTQFPVRFRAESKSTPIDLLEISPSEARNKVQRKPRRKVRVNIHNEEKIENTNIEDTKLNLCLSASNLNSTVNEDPLRTGNHEVQANFDKHFLCTRCEMKFSTFVERNRHVLGVHEHHLCSHTSQEQCTLAFCHINISIPTYQQLERKKYSSTQGLNFKSVEGETREERNRRKSREYAQRQSDLRRQSETPEEKTARLAAQAEYRRNRLINETPQERYARLAVRSEYRRNRLANQTEEERNARLASATEQKRKYSANETPEEKSENYGDTFHFVPC